MNKSSVYAKLAGITSAVLILGWSPAFSAAPPPPWTAAASLTSTSATLQFDCLQAVSSPDGSKLAALWRDYDSSSAASGVAFAGSSNGGATFSSPADISDVNTYTAYSPQLAMSKDGSRLAAVWRSDPATGDPSIIVRSSTDVGANWSPRATVRTSGYLTQPGIALSGTGARMLTAWWEYDSALDKLRVRASTSSDSGSSWSLPTTLSGNVDSSVVAPAPKVVVSTDGSKLAVFWLLSVAGQFKVQVAASTDSGATWGTAQNLSASGVTDSDDIQVAASADGSRITATWAWFDNSNWRIQASSSANAGATWSTAVNLSDPGQDASGPVVASSADGTKVTAAWARSNATYFVIQAKTSTNSGSSWGSVQNVSPTDSDALNPRLVSSTDGKKLVLTWTKPPASGMSYTLQTSTSTRGAWSTAQTIDGNTALFSSRLAASSDAGKLVVLWLDATDMTLVKYSTNGQKVRKR